MFRLEVIDFVDHSGQALVARVPQNGTAAIQFGAQLIVQQNQEAVFFRDGRAMDSFGPGRHTLTTANVPILTRILTSPWEKSPFQACVYFVGKHRFVDQRWGTRHPITMKDPDFGIVRLRGFGKYSFRVVDAPLLINELVGTQGLLTTEEVGNYLRDVLLSGLTDLLATANVGLLQMAAKFDEIGAAARAKLGEQFKTFGLELTDFVINNISPPEEVQKAIDARSSMTVLGDLRSYTLYQAANGIAGAGGGAAGSVAALGVGAGVGMMLPPLLQQAMQQAPVTASPVASAPTASNPVIESTPIDLASVAKSSVSVSDIQDTLRKVGRQLKWEISEADQEWKIVVSIGALRKQTVHVNFNGIDDAGHRLISFWSSCGAVDPNNALTLLRYNAQIVHGAFALQNEGGTEVLVLRGNLLADTADLLELTRTVTAIAWQADQVEQQMVGIDQA